MNQFDEVYSIVSQSMQSERLLKIAPVHSQLFVLLALALSSLSNIINQAICQIDF